MEFSRPEYWSEWPFPSPRDLPNPRIEPRSPTLQADSLPAEPQGKPRSLQFSSVTQSCLTLCDPMNYTVHGILQARILEWVAFPFSRGTSQPKDWTQVFHIAGWFLTTEPHEKSSLTFTLSKWISGCPCGSTGKESACNAGDLGSIPGLGSSPGEGKGYPLQYSGLENSMDWNGPWGHKESDMTEQLSLSFFIINIPVILYLL